MELHEANKILRSVKAALAADGAKLPPSVETDGLMMLLGRLDCEKFLAPKIKHARAVAPSSSAYKRLSAQILFFRALEAVKTGIQDPVTTVSLMLLHKYVCGDLDNGAGKPRQTEYTENGSAHTSPAYIAGSIKSIVTKMNDIEASPAISKEDFAGYITHYMRELIILHPFESFSALTVRIFLMLFCRIKGFSLGLYRTSPAAVKSAEDAAFTADDVTPLYKVLIDCLSYERTVEKKPPTPKTRRELRRDIVPAPPDGISPYENKSETDDDGTIAPKQIKQREPRQRPPKPNKPTQIEKTDKLDKPVKPIKPERTDRNDKPDKTERPEKTEKQNKSEKPENPDERRRARPRPPANRPAPNARRQSDGDVLKRAIKLQQKISRLNDQLTELMLSEKDDGNGTDD